MGTISQFLLRLQIISLKAGWKTIYVHPVVPVLNETRRLVIDFNKVYERLVKELTIKTRKNNKRSADIVWLDFFDKLIVRGEENMEFNEIYKMDGTHLLPSYVHLIEQCLHH